MTTEATTRRRESLFLAEELLSDIELGRIRAMDVARKASRLARLLDDTNAMAWFITGTYLVLGDLLRLRVPTESLGE